MQPAALQPAALVGVTAFVLLAIILYFWRVESGLSRTPADAAKLAQKHWTIQEMRESYQKVQHSPTDVRPFLFPKRGRRYVVSGGSGLVGGWIVNHLIMRGEDPAAIRILDLKPPTRPEVAKYNVQFVQTDVSDPTSVSKAFNAPWGRDVAKLPLTTFHTVAYISPADRTWDFMSTYEKVNVNGTRNMLDAAETAGASCFIATSSGSVGVKPINFFFAPWKRSPDDFVQMSVNADPKNPNGTLEDFAGCYPYSKALAEKLVRSADNKASGFRTGCIRPAHAIYGHGVDNPSSLTLDYLTRGGTPTWAANVVCHFVDAQNVSIAHLAYENTLLNDPNSAVGGRAYCCTDPDPPILFADLYKVLTTLAHPMNPMSFPILPSAPMLLLATAIEAYSLLRHRYLRFLPRITGDLAILQPAIWQVACINVLYDDSLAKEIGYKAPITTLEGVCHSVLYFNQQVEAKLAKEVTAGKGGEVAPSSPSSVPKPPKVH